MDLGGSSKRQAYRLPKAYHIAITQEFRRNWSYGQRPPSEHKRVEILLDVYSRYPIPQLIGIEP